MWLCLLLKLILLSVLPALIREFSSPFISYRVSSQLHLNSKCILSVPQSTCTQSVWRNSVVLTIVKVMHCWKRCLQHYAKLFATLCGVWNVKCVLKRGHDIVWSIYGSKVFNTVRNILIKVLKFHEYLWYTTETYLITKDRMQIMCKDSVSRYPLVHRHHFFLFHYVRKE